VVCSYLCEATHIATNVEIDPALIQQALLLGGKRTKREVIEEALREYVLRREQQRILSLFGTIEYDEGYDYKEQRARK
jgi:Arc/MetJ family transcription regulator